LSAEASYQTHHAKTAKDFLDLLGPTTNEWSEVAYIFRGQADHNWKLEPSAFRTSGILTSKSFTGQDLVVANQQRRFEAKVLRRFLDACDLSGLSVPGYSRAADNLLDKHLDGNANLAWPEELFDETLAVAQHYGIPTRLLDWTRRSFVAAYFAASSARQLPNPPDMIAVWGLSITHKSFWTNIDLIKLPGGTAANLAAQSGLFTISRGLYGHNQQLQGLESEPDLYKGRTYTDKPALVKVTLPFSETRDLLATLSNYGVTAPVLFPGMEGARRHVMDWAHGDFI
jgi:hypothetical protein